MKLWKCNDCGKEISVNAKSCPNCGSEAEHALKEYREVEQWLRQPSIKPKAKPSLSTKEQEREAVRRRRRWIVTTVIMCTGLLVGFKVYFTGPSETALKKPSSVVADPKKHERFLWVKNYVRFVPAIGSDGTVYVGSSDNWHRKLYALDGKSGVKLWEFEEPIGEVNSSPAIGSDGTVYVGVQMKVAGHLVCALDGKTGVKKWEFNTGIRFATSPAIGADDTVYVGLNSYFTRHGGESYGDDVLALDGSTGAKKWGFETNSRRPMSLWNYFEDAYGGNVITPPVIGADGTVYIVAQGKRSDRGAKQRPRVYALDGKTGTWKWEFDIGKQSIRSSPAIGADGTVYIGSHDDNMFYALNGQTGVKKWEIKLSIPMMGSSPAIGSDGTVYVGSKDNKLYAIKTDSKGLAKSPWPMRGQNPQNTGRVPLTKAPVAPLPQGRTVVWTTGVNRALDPNRILQQSIDVFFRGKSYMMVQQHFGKADQIQNSWWGYTGLNITDRHGGKYKTAWFGFANGVVQQVRIEK